MDGVRRWGHKDPFAGAHLVSLPPGTQQGERREVAGLLPATVLGMLWAVRDLQGPCRVLLGTQGPRVGNAELCSPPLF